MVIMPKCTMENFKGGQQITDVLWYLMMWKALSRMTSFFQTDLAHLQAQECLPTLWKPKPIWQKKENGCATVRTQCVCVCIQKCIAIYIQDVSWSIELDRIWKVAFITVSVGRKIVEFFMAFPVSSAMSCSQFTASLIDTRYLHVCWQ